MGSYPKARVRLTRRKFAAGLAGTAAGMACVSPAAVMQSPAPAVQKTPPQGAPAPATSAATPEQKLEKAYADIRATSERLSKIEVPMDTEPAFAFRP